MSAHTDGRIEAFKINDFTFTLVKAGGGGWDDDLLEADDGATPSFINPADARRLAACWNAFVGLPTDDIEQVVQNKGPLAQKMVRDDAERDQMCAELAAARALLADILDSYDKSVGELREMGMPTAHTNADAMERIRALLNGGA